MSIGKEINGVLYSPVVYEALTVVPLRDTRPKATNWMAILRKKEGYIPQEEAIFRDNNLDRIWMEKGREGFYFFIYAKEAGVKRYLQVGDAIEFGCKFQPDPSIKPERIFWWGCCSGLSATEARFIRAENPLKAIEMGHSIVEALAFADLSEDSISVEISRIEARQLEIQQEWERLEQQKETLKAGKKTC